MNLKERAKQLKEDIPVILLCLKAKETPRSAKVLASITLLYALSPIDLIPDFIPFLGYLDDIILLPMFIALTLHCIPKDIFLHYQGIAKATQAAQVKKRWLCALPILAIWFLAVYIFLQLFI